uniref:uncharacterized protein LOC120336358 isoform X1 n=1 Tax=Styela clava TaxID=7725 RepID=UPI001939C5D9|nr:uncharacterized protein LOC120336358 isoform X1 [Styela clava]
MTSESQTPNGVTLNRLRRTLTLPLSKMKPRSNSFQSSHQNALDVDINKKNEERNSNGHNSRKRLQRNNVLSNSMRNPVNRKGDIRVSQYDLKNQKEKQEQNDSIIVEKKNGQPVIQSGNGQVLGAINESGENLIIAQDNSTTGRKGKKKRPRRARRWPTQTLARVLERISISMKKNEHAASVLRTVTVHRKPGETLGIYIKEVKRNVSNSSNFSDSEGDKKTIPRSCIVISRLAQDSVAAKQGILRNGDEVLLVNHRDISELSLTEVAAMMDYHQQLVLSVRSKYISVNNNNEEKISTDQCDCKCTSTDSSTSQTDCCHSPNKSPTSVTICSQDSVFSSSKVPRCSSDSLNTNHTREEAIPSVYDNNFPSTLVNSVPSPDEVDSHSKPKGRVEIEYDEAFQILLNAINSFEKPQPPSIITCQNSKVSNSDFRPASYWAPLNQIISNNSENDSTTGTSIDNEDCSGTSDSPNTSMSNTPQFPSTSELPFSDDPEYDEVAASELGEAPGDEVQVDGCAHLFIPYRRQDSLSSEVSENLPTVNAVYVSTATSANDEAHQSSDYHKDTMKVTRIQGENVTGAHSTNPIISVENSTVPLMPHTTQIAASSLQHLKPGHVITVGQRREWLDKGKDISPELKTRLDWGNKKRNDISESAVPDVPPRAGEHAFTFSEKHSQMSSHHTGRRTSSESSTASSHIVATTPLPHENYILPGPSLDRSPIEKSPKSLFKVLQLQQPLKFESSLSYEESRKDSKADQQPVISTPTHQRTISNPSSRTFWSKVTSPPRLRKNRIGKKITKRIIKKKGSSDGDTTDPPSTDGLNDSVSVVDRYHLESGEDQRRLSCQFVTDNRPHDPSIKPLNLSDFKKYKPPVPNADGKYSQTPIAGSLVITLYGARDIKKTVSEVYCIAQVDDDVKHRIRTRMQPCRGSVAWNDCYEAKLEDAYDLHITLYSWEAHGNNHHKTLAKSTLPISDLLCGVIGVPVKLAVKLEPRGTLYIKLSVEDPSTMAGPKVFGADLQSILDREQSGLSIPLLVNDCIREVEARGMSVVGIYRLCGSAIAKRELRKKYEDNSKSVDLSQENYPDVNVITGILKDFLRELPQPLFPPELLEAVTIAMENSTASSRVTSVSSPFEPTPPVDFPDLLVDGVIMDEDIPTGRQSAIFNLLEVERKVNLPPAERATLYALLNHLKRVSANQVQNKMTCQNLAVCFGPVLLGSINMGPSKGLDLTAAIGFKRHIQVLNFMVSNWPRDPVPLHDADDILENKPERVIDSISNGDSRRASKRISRVSLTRRISYVFSTQTGSNHSSTSGSLNVELDNIRTTIPLSKQVLNNTRKSGSLTNILESNLDACAERVLDKDGYFQQDEHDILLQDCDDEFLRERSVDDSMLFER